MLIGLGLRRGLIFRSQIPFSMIISTRSFIAAMAFSLCAVVAVAQDSYTDKSQAYVDKYKDVAMAEMQRSGVPASITLAQGLLESSCGCSPLATKGNNHFGIKCNDNWTGKTMTYDDDAKDECFRCYTSVEESFRDHSDFLRTRQRYAFLFDLPPTDYKKWAQGLKQAGYATNPKYPELLINNIEKYNLSQYDIYDSFVADNTTKPSTKPQQANTQQEHKSFSDFVNNIGKPKPATTKASDDKVMYVNNLKAVRLQQGETVAQVGKRYHVGAKGILKFNDLTVGEQLTAGTMLYVQPKRRMGDSMYHVVRINETMYSISQLHGIRLSYLYTKNNMEFGAQPAVGEVLYLKDKRTTTPILRGNEPKPVVPEPSTSLASIGSRSAVAPASEDASPRYAKPMSTDALFPPAGSDKVDASLNVQQNTEATPVNTTPTDNATPNNNTVTASTEPTVDYITTAETEGVDYYTVKPKDTLYSIGRAYGLSVDKLMEINQLGSNVISSGMRLRVKP